MKAMKPAKFSMPRHQGWGGLLTKIAKSTQLKTEDVKGVLAAAHDIAIAEVKEGREVVIPQLTALKLKPPPPAAFGVALNDPDNTLSAETL